MVNIPVLVCCAVREDLLIHLSSSFIKDFDSHWQVELRTSRKLGQKTQKISTDTKCSRLIKAILDTTVNTTYHLNQACPNCSTAGFCSNRSRAQYLTSSQDWDRLIKWVMSGVLLLGWKENLQPLGPSWNSLDVPDLNQSWKSRIAHPLIYP